MDIKDQYCPNCGVFLSDDNYDEDDVHCGAMCCHSCVKLGKVVSIGGVLVKKSDLDEIYIEKSRIPLSEDFEGFLSWVENLPNRGFFPPYLSIELVDIVECVRHKLEKLENLEVK